MKIYATKYLGYCKGVSKAIEMAKTVRNNYYDKNVYIFGELVHNKDVVKELEKLDIKTIDLNRFSPLEALNSLGKNDILIFTAHGHKRVYEKILYEKGILYFDAICPLVKENNRLIREYAKKGKVIYIGKKNHPETIASISINKNVYLYDISEKPDLNSFDYPNPLVINQTTLSVSELNDIHREIKGVLPSSIIANEICPATRLREEEILKIPTDVDMIIVIGSSTSSNTDKLYTLALKTFKDAKVIKIENLDELKLCSLENINYVAITSGTSTPLYIIKEIEEYLKGVNE